MPRAAKLPPNIHWPTEEEEAAINRGIALDPDNPEITDEQWKRMRPASEVMPEIVEGWRKRQGRPPINEAPKVHIGFRLAADVVTAIRASGPGYNARVEKVLRVALARGKF
jgi:uncharacterized protein (DUF4415 family)